MLVKTTLEKINKIPNFGDEDNIIESTKNLTVAERVNKFMETALNNKNQPLTNIDDVTLEGLESTVDEYIHKNQLTRETTDYTTVNSVKKAKNMFETIAQNVNYKPQGQSPDKHDRRPDDRTGKKPRDDESPDRFGKKPTDKTGRRPGDDDSPDKYGNRPGDKTGRKPGDDDSPDRYGRKPGDKTGRRPGDNDSPDRYGKKPGDEHSPDRYGRQPVDKTGRRPGDDDSPDRYGRKPGDKTGRRPGDEHSPDRYGIKPSDRTNKRPGDVGSPERYSKMPVDRIGKKPGDRVGKIPVDGQSPDRYGMKPVDRTGKHPDDYRLPNKYDKKPTDRLGKKPEDEDSPNKFGRSPKTQDTPFAAKKSPEKLFPQTHSSTVSRRPFDSPDTNKSRLYHQPPDRPDQKFSSLDLSLTKKLKPIIPSLDSPFNKDNVFSDRFGTYPKRTTHHPEISDKDRQSPSTIRSSVFHTTTSSYSVYNTDDREYMSDLLPKSPTDFTSPTRRSPNAFDSFPSSLREPTGSSPSYKSPLDKFDSPTTPKKSPSKEIADQLRRGTPKKDTPLGTSRAPATKTHPSSRITDSLYKPEQKRPSKEKPQSVVDKYSLMNYDTKTTKTSSTKYYDSPFSPDKKLSDRPTRSLIDTKPKTNGYTSPFDSPLSPTFDKANKIPEKEGLKAPALLKNQKHPDGRKYPSSYDSPYLNDDDNDEYDDIINKRRPLSSNVKPSRITDSKVSNFGITLKKTTTNFIKKGPTDVGKKETELDRIYDLDVLQTMVSFLLFFSIFQHLHN